MSNSISILGKLDSSSYASVSVVVPVYNHERYIEKCLDSIVNTIYPDLEIIILDDASVDASDQIICQWTRNTTAKTVHIRHSENAGLTKSLNEAVKTAQGEYICLIAGDDLLLANGIIDRVNYLEANPHKMAVFSDCHVIDETGIIIHESGIEDLHTGGGISKVALLTDYLIPYEIALRWFVPGPVFMCRRETFHTIGYYNEDLLTEDWDFYLRIASTNKLGFCNSYVANYRIHSTSMMRTVAKQIADSDSIVAGKNAHRFPPLIAAYLYGLYLKHIGFCTSSWAKKFLCLVISFFLVKTSRFVYQLRRRKAIGSLTQKSISINQQEA